jgi:glucose-1-phosphate adenylyltransferase
MITDFFEKPADPEILEKYKINEATFKAFDLDPSGRTHVASMGIYIFKKEVLFELLQQTEFEDFGREVIPSSLKKTRVSAYFFDGYWEDIGTMRAFFDAHFELTKPVPQFNFYDEKFPFFTNPRFLPPSKIYNCQINQSIISEGSILLGSIVENSVIGIRSFIDEGTFVQRSIIMGNTRYESVEQRNARTEKDPPNLGIGRNCIIRNAIVDLDVRIGNNVQLVNKDNKDREDGENYTIRDGIIIIPKGAVIPENMSI